MKAILPLLDEQSKRPYYLQVYDHIKKAILSGEIMEGEKLPSLRSLAKSTTLSVTTIEQCYNQLLVEGYIYSRAQSGYYVSRVFSHSHKTAAANNNIFSLHVSSIDSTLRETASPLKYDPDCFDFNKWKKCNS